jgi:hypothetical protein
MYLTGFPSILHTPRVEIVKEICVLVHYIRAADRHAALLASYGRYCTVCMYVCAKNDKRNMYVGEYLSIYFFKIFWTLSVYSRYVCTYVCMYVCMYFNECCKGFQLLYIVFIPIIYIYILILIRLGRPVRSVYICSDDVESEIISVENLNLRFPRNWSYVHLPHT